MLEAQGEPDRSSACRRANPGRNARRRFHQLGHRHPPLSGLQSLFFPSPHVTPAPSGARDLRVEVAPGVGLHARLHHRDGTRAALLLFHGNGEVVSHYDEPAARFADAGVDLTAGDVLVDVIDRDP